MHPTFVRLASTGPTGAAAITALVASLSLFAGCGQQQSPNDAASAIFSGASGAWIDLTHPFDDDTIYWPTDSLGFELDELAYGETDAGFFYSAYRFSTAEHGGTHLDAPIHFARGAQTADELPLTSLIGPAVVVDVSDHASPDYQVTVDDLQRFTDEYGPIPDGSVVLIRTGWGARWNNRASYLGTALTGAAAIPNLHFPGIGAEAAAWLADQGNVSAVGIDTPSIDHGQSSDFAAHVALYKHNIPGFENVAALDQLPPTGAFVVALPMKIAGGSGAPLRIVAYVPGK